MTAAEQFIADARAAMRLTEVWQYEIAERIRCSPKHLSEILNGHTRLAFEHAEAIADALGFDLDVRFVLRHEPTTETPAPHENGTR